MGKTSICFEVKSTCIVSIQLSTLKITFSDRGKPFESDNYAAALQNHIRIPHTCSYFVQQQTPRNVTYWARNRKWYRIWKICSITGARMHTSFDGNPKEHSLATGLDYQRHNKWQRFLLDHPRHNKCVFLVRPSQIQQQVSDFLVRPSMGAAPGLVTMETLSQFLAAARTIVGPPISIISMHPSNGFSSATACKPLHVIICTHVSEVILKKCISVLCVSSCEVYVFGNPLG